MPKGHFHNLRVFALLTAATSILLLLAAAGVATAVCDSTVREVQADRSATAAWVIPRLELARRLRPDLSEPWELSATYEQSVDAQRARKWQLRALRLEPTSWRNWQELGGIDIQLGRTRAALRDFQTAARYSAGFEAHYALANAAFVLGDAPMFRRQMAVALRIAPAGLVPTALASAIRLERSQSKELIAILPQGRPAVTATAIQYLAEAGQLSGARFLWRRLECPGYDAAACAQAAQVLASAYRQSAESLGAQPPVLSGPGASAADVAASRAVKVWNRALARGFLRGPRVATGAVTDPRFRFPWRLSAFGWQGGAPNVRRVRTADAGNAIRIRLDGYESSDETLLWQWLVVQPKVKYELSLTARGRKLVNPEGVAAEVFIAGGNVIARVPARPGAGWSTTRGIIRVPAGHSVLQLVLVYRRPLGVPLMRGTVLIRSVGLAREGTGG